VYGGEDLSGLRRRGYFGEARKHDASESKTDFIAARGAGADLLASSPPPDGLAAAS
jgi:hypothetical protein